MLKNRLATLAAASTVLAIALLPAGCAGVRDATRSTFNTDMVSRQAPSFTGTEWILPADVPQPPHLRDTWSLVMFFDPG